MSQEIFRKLRQMLMEKLDVYRELTDQEILETIDAVSYTHLDVYKRQRLQCGAPHRKTAFYR